MDHDVVVRQKMTERYLLNELESGTRDEFEEHFFGCPECALDVRVGAAFVDQTKTILSEAAPISPSQIAPAPPRQGWLFWLRPAFTLPVLAALLMVVGYQNLVTVPHMKQALSAQVLPWAGINIGTYGDTGPEITTPRGQGFLLLLRIPPQAGYSRYTAELHNPSSQTEWSVTIPASASQERWPVTVPGADRQPGTYSVVVRGITASGESVEVGRGSFEVHISN